ncbi:hypothetical protein BX600DRAFT_545910 [Xylariales sp. PMI_506]|nr:hypothetical protein BX600DRAFT_545910 [Xylariales sp. PMI_506]
MPPCLRYDDAFGECHPSLSGMYLNAASFPVVSIPPRQSISVHCELAKHFLTQSFRVNKAAIRKPVSQVLSMVSIILHLIVALIRPAACLIVSVAAYVADNRHMFNWLARLYLFIFPDHIREDRRTVPPSARTPVRTMERSRAMSLFQDASDDSEQQEVDIYFPPFVPDNNNTIDQTNNDNDNLEASGDDTAMEECPICRLEMRAPQDFVKLPCGHSFCPPCIRHWLGFSGKQSCPLCRGLLRHECRHTIRAAFLRKGAMLPASFLQGTCAPDLGCAGVMDYCQITWWLRGDYPPPSPIVAWLAGEAAMPPELLKWARNFAPHGRPLFPADYEPRNHEMMMWFSRDVMLRVDSQVWPVWLVDRQGKRDFGLICDGKFQIIWRPVYTNRERFGFQEWHEGEPGYELLDVPEPEQLEHDSNIRAEVHHRGGQQGSSRSSTTTHNINFTNANDWRRLQLMPSQNQRFWENVYDQREWRSSQAIRADLSGHMSSHWAARRLHRLHGHVRLLEAEEARMLTRLENAAERLTSVRRMVDIAWAVHSEAYRRTVGDLRGEIMLYHVLPAGELRQGLTMRPAALPAQPAPAPIRYRPWSKRRGDSHRAPPQAPPPSATRQQQPQQQQQEQEQPQSTGAGSLGQRYTHLRNHHDRISAGHDRCSEEYAALVSALRACQVRVAVRASAERGLAVRRLRCRRSAPIAGPRNLRERRRLLWRAERALVLADESERKFRGAQGGWDLMCCTQGREDGSHGAGTGGAPTAGGNVDSRRRSSSSTNGNSSGSRSGYQTSNEDSQTVIITTRSEGSQSEDEYSSGAEAEDTPEGSLGVEEEDWTGAIPLPPYDDEYDDVNDDIPEEEDDDEEDIEEEEEEEEEEIPFPRLERQPRQRVVTRTARTAVLELSEGGSTTAPEQLSLATTSRGVMNECT